MGARLMKIENLKIVQRVLCVFVFATLAGLMIWRANCYVDPGGYTGMPQTFLCLTGFVFGFTAFSIGLGLAEPDPQTDCNTSR
jgi:hypothetical protein